MLGKKILALLAAEEIEKLSKKLSDWLKMKAEQEKTEDKDK